MVRLPPINTAERTLCQDNIQPRASSRSRNPSSFWLSVARKDYGDVYSRPATDQYPSVHRPERGIKSWTYHYSPRSKAPNWDWHYERPIPKTPPSKNASTQDFSSPDVAPTDLALKEGAEADYIRDYSDPEEYAKYMENKGQDDAVGSKSCRHGRQPPHADRNSHAKLRPEEVPLHEGRHNDFYEGLRQGRLETQSHPGEDYLRRANHYDLTDQYHRSGRYEDDDVTRPNDNMNSFRGNFDELNLDLERYQGYSQDGARSHEEETGEVRGQDKGEEEGRGQGEQATTRVNYKYKRISPERYVSETMASYKFFNTPRSENKTVQKEPAVGIIPANELSEPDPFERMLPNCDREDTVKMATFPLMTYGRKKKVSYTPRENDVILPDPSPVDSFVPEKSFNRKKYIPGPPDCLKVPGFDGGAPPPTRTMKKPNNYEHHRSKQSQILIG